jgi:hypothetical protein
LDKGLLLNSSKGFSVMALLLRAVKTLDVEECGDREFRSEVSAIASLQHVTLVRFLGYCCVNPAERQFLIHDFISCKWLIGQLDTWI